MRKKFLALLAIPAALLVIACNGAPNLGGSPDKSLTPAQQHEQVMQQAMEECAATGSVKCVRVGFHFQIFDVDMKAVPNGTDDKPECGLPGVLPTDREGYSADYTKTAFGYPDPKVRAATLPMPLVQLPSHEPRITPFTVCDDLPLYDDYVIDAESYTSVEISALVFLPAGWTIKCTTFENKVPIFDNIASNMNLDPSSDKIEGLPADEHVECSWHDWDLAKA